MFLLLYHRSLLVRPALSSKGDGEEHLVIMKVPGSRWHHDDEPNVVYTQTHTASKVAADAAGAKTFLGMSIKARMIKRGRNGASPIPALQNRGV